jgi:hypothetical protein
VQNQDERSILAVTFILINVWFLINVVELLQSSYWIAAHTLRPVLLKVVAGHEESDLFSRSNERFPDVICLLLRWEECMCGLAACHS